MELALRIGSRLRQVRVARQAGGLVVTVDGRSWTVDVRSIGADTLSLLLTEPDGPARSVEASLAPLGTPGAFEVHVAGCVVPVQVQNGRGAGARGGASPGGSGPLRVAAPMPGKIVRVLVKAGDDVRARQGLVVVEAMKMENELRAARDGRVRAVVVEEGQSVDAGAVLVEIDAIP